MSAQDDAAGAAPSALAPQQQQAAAAAAAAAAATAATLVSGDDDGAPLTPDVFEAGAVLVWGRAGDLLPAGKVDREGVAPFPVRVALPHKARAVLVAAGHRRAAAVDAAGVLYTWGSGYKGALGLGSASDAAAPTPVHCAEIERDGGVAAVSLGEDHGVCATRNSGHVLCWGNGVCGALGDGLDSHHDSAVPRIVVDADGVPLRGVVRVCAGHANTAAITRDGELYMWGSNDHGKCGVRSSKVKGSVHAFVQHPTRVPIDGRVARVSLGWHDTGAVTADGALYMWGSNLNGNLGLGTRKEHHTPQRVRGALDGVPVADVACTRHLHTVFTPITSGTEGCHTHAITRDGRVFSMGTSHKGVLGNTKNKGLTVDCGYDELLPYEVGSPYRDEPHAGPSHYLAGEHVLRGVSSGLHSGFVTRSGRVVTVGCGSSGRMGVLKYMTGLHGERSRMKCYVPAPTDVYTMQPTWHALLVDSSRSAMVALAVPARADTYQRPADELEHDDAAAAAIGFGPKAESSDSASAKPHHH